MEEGNQVPEQPKMVTIGKPQITSTIFTSSSMAIGGTLIVVGGTLFNKEPKKQTGLIVAGALIFALGFILKDNPEF